LRIPQAWISQETSQYRRQIFDPDRWIEYFVVFRHAGHNLILF
jgi:hypothetical protein